MRLFSTGIDGSGWVLVFWNLTRTAPCSSRALPAGSSRTVSELFWALPRQFLSILVLLPDRFWAFLGSSWTVSCSKQFSIRRPPCSNPPGQFLGLFGLLLDSFVLVCAPGQFLSLFKSFQFLSFFGLLPDSFWAFLGSSRTVFEPFWVLGPF